jgi:hypothetical protein
MPPVEEDGDLERRATPELTGVDADAAREADVEFAMDVPPRRIGAGCGGALTASAVTRLEAVTRGPYCWQAKL